MNELLKPQRDRSFENEVNEVKGAAEETTYKVSDNGHAVDSKEDVDRGEVTPVQDNKGKQIDLQRTLARKNH